MRVVERRAVRTVAPITISKICMVFFAKADGLTPPASQMLVTAVTVPIRFKFLQANTGKSAGTVTPRQPAVRVTVTQAGTVTIIMMIATAPGQGGTVTRTSKLCESDLELPSPRQTVKRLGQSHF